jgi:ABC-type bacteriocin/lantibiotic exporter with double-glycine peptidase domain
MRVSSVLTALLVCLITISAEGSGLWLDVPFVKQQGKGCGAAAISMILQYWSRHDAIVESSAYDPDRIMERLFSKQAGGIFASEMEKYFEDHGFRVFISEGTRSDLENHLQKGRPLIVCLDEKSLHYVVVAGIDSNRKLIFLNDPAQKKLMQMDWADFEKMWGAMKHWMLLAVPGKPK